MARPSAKISNGPGLGFKLLGAGLTGLAVPMPALLIRMSSRSDVAWTAPKTSCGRGARSRACCSSRSSPRRPCKIRTTYMFSWLVIMFGRVDPDEPVIRGRDQSSRPIEVHPIAGRSVLGFAGQWMVATADIEDPNAILRI